MYQRGRFDVCFFTAARRLALPSALSEPLVSFPQCSPRVSEGHRDLAPIQWYSLPQVRSQHTQARELGPRRIVSPVNIPARVWAIAAFFAPSQLLVFRLP